MKIYFAVVSALFVVTACQKTDAPPPSAPSKPMAATAEVSTPPPRVFTRTDWKRTFESSFEKRDAKTDNNGVTEYTACFDPSESKKGCGIVAFGRADAFQKLHYLTMPNSKINDIADLNVFPLVMVIASECEAPRIFISPRFNAKGGWLFLSKASFMVDGEVVLEHAFANDEVKRDNSGAWVHERAGWLVSKSEIESLRRIVNGDVTISRFTGDKGYYTIKKDMQEGFVKDARHALSVLDRAAAAFDRVGGPSCSTP